MFKENAGAFKTFKPFNRFATFKPFRVLGFEREFPRFGNSRNVEMSCGELDASRYSSSDDWP
jgi:hypothetical protein